MFCRGRHDGALVAMVVVAATVTTWVHLSSPSRSAWVDDCLHTIVCVSPLRLIVCRARAGLGLMLIVLVMLVAATVVAREAVISARTSGR